MTPLHSPAGSLSVPDDAPAFAAPPGLTSVLSVESRPPGLFRPGYVCHYRMCGGCGSMTGPLSAVCRLHGRVVVEVDGRWVIAEVGRA